MIDCKEFNNNYNLSRLKDWADKHGKAVKSKDTMNIERIENMLMRLNLQAECVLFKSGKYKEAIENFKKED